MDICLRKPHVIGYEKKAGTTNAAFQMVTDMKAFLEEHFDQDLKIEVDYRVEGVNTKTSFHLYELGPKKWRFIYSVIWPKKQRVLLSISISSCGEWAMNDISCRVSDPRIKEAVYNKLYEYAEQHSLVIA